MEAMTLASRRQTPSGGNDAKVHAIFAESYRRLVVQMYGMTGDVAVAEELVQEGFVRGAAAGPGFLALDDPEAWLRSVAIDVQRSQWRKLRNFSRIRERLGAPPSDLPGLEDRLDVIDALRTLPQGQREVVALHYLADLGVTEVAETLGIEEGTGKYRLSRARHALSRALADTENRVMHDQKMSEFRERAHVAVTLPDLDRILESGRRLHRRRQVGRVTAMAVVAVVAFGLFESRGDIQSDPAPAPTNKVTRSAGPPPLLGATSGLLKPQTYGIDGLVRDGRADLLVDVVGEKWQTWQGVSWMTSPDGTVSWGLNSYSRTSIDRCRPDQHATTRAAAIAQLSHIAGTVTQPARPTRRLGMTGTHMQLRVPVDPTCPGGVPPTAHNLMAIWDGGSTSPTVTVDVWLLGEGPDMTILTSAVRGTPATELLDALVLTLDSLRRAPTPLLGEQHPGRQSRGAPSGARPRLRRHPSGWCAPRIVLVLNGPATAFR